MYVQKLKIFIDEPPSKSAAVHRGTYRSTVAESISNPNLWLERQATKYTLKGSAMSIVDDEAFLTADTNTIGTYDVIRFIMSRVDLTW